MSRERPKDGGAQRQPEARPEALEGAEDMGRREPTNPGRQQRHQRKHADPSAIDDEAKISHQQGELDDGR